MATVSSAKLAICFDWPASCVGIWPAPLLARCCAYAKSSHHLRSTRFACTSIKMGSIQPASIHNWLANNSVKRTAFRGRLPQALGANL